MNERLSKVLECEKRLLQERLQLQELIAESKDDSKLIRTKLDYLEKEIIYMNQQVVILKEELSEREQIPEWKLQPEVEQPEMEQPEVVLNPEPELQPAIQPQPTPQAMVKFDEAPVEKSAQSTETTYAASQEPVKKDLEKTIGKSLMGIFASILIFISLILFATAILPHFGDEAKMFTTYIVSFAFLAIGLFKWKRNKSNKFYMALTACGVGALYISLLLSNMYFKAIDDIALYILIAVWGLGVCFLCRIQATLFQIIGHIGILISIIFGCILCMEAGDEIKFTVLLIYYFVASTMFFAMNPQKEMPKNIIFHVFNALNYLILVPCSCSLFGDGPSGEVFALLMFLALNIGVLLWSKAGKYGISFMVFSSLFLWMFWVVLVKLMEFVPIEAAGVTRYIIAMILFLVFEWKELDEKVCKYIPQLWLLCMAGGSLQCGEFWGDYMYVPLLVLPMLLLGYFRENTFCKYVSLFLMALYLFKGIDNSAAHFWLALGAVVLLHTFMYIKKENYNPVYKYILHTLTILILWILFSGMLDDMIYNITGEYESEGVIHTLAYTLVATFNLVMMKTPLGYNVKTGEKENPAYYNAVNMILMIVGLAGITAVENEVCHLIMILLVLVVFMVNAKNLLDKRENIFAGIYVGFKFTVLVIVILNSFEAANYVISISCFILAIIGVVLGFRFQYKALRLFGLILSMISTFKLIMVDISYENTLGNALSFFASGILCFVISLIYSLIDGKIGKERK